MKLGVLLTREDEELENSGITRVLKCFGKKTTAFNKADVL